MNPSTTAGRIRVDGTWHQAPAGGVRLVDWLRDSAGCTSVKEGCGTGQCGACSVFVGSTPVLACCVLAVTVTGRQIRTADGLTATRTGARLQEALGRHGGVQCGFCTPGMMVAGTAWILGEGSTSCAGRAASLQRALAGNICRCTGYRQIIEAILDAAGDHVASPVQAPRHGKPDSRGEKDE